MITLIVVTFVDLFVRIFNIILLVRIIASYLVRAERGFYRGLVNLTEPVLAPVRRMLPATPGLDLAPLATFFLLQGLDSVVHLVARM